MDVSVFSWYPSLNLFSCILCFFFLFSLFELGKGEAEEKVGSAPNATPPYGTCLLTDSFTLTNTKDRKRNIGHHVGAPILSKLPTPSEEEDRKRKKTRTKTGGRNKHTTKEVKRCHSLLPIEHHTGGILLCSLSLSRSLYRSSQKHLQQTLKMARVHYVQLTYTYTRIVCTPHYAVVSCATVAVGSAAVGTSAASAVEFIVAVHPNRGACACRLPTIVEFCFSDPVAVHSLTVR